MDPEKDIEKEIAQLRMDIKLAAGATIIMLKRARDILRGLRERRQRSE